MQIALWALTITCGCALGWQQTSLKLEQVIYLFSVGLGAIFIGIAIGWFGWKMSPMDMIALKDLRYGVVLISFGYIAMISLMVAAVRTSAMKLFSFLKRRLSSP